MTSTYFIFGGARCGKSRYAQGLAESLSPNRTYVATAESRDAEMAERIERHIADRDASWTTVEAPIKLSEAIDAAGDEDEVVVVDCLTLWLSNILLSKNDVERAVESLSESVERTGSKLILVANEVGLGIVPDNRLGRRFRDEQGRLNQRMAAVCDQVELIVAGLPLRLKG